MKNLFNVSTLWIAGVLIAQAPVVLGQNPQGAPPRPPTTQSPASHPRPKSTTPQNYTAEQIRAGEIRFGSQCGFCHGKDAAGGETGTDLTRSSVVAQDVHGDKMEPVIRGGRPNAGMPSFSSLSEEELSTIVAYVHSQMDKFATLGGGRRSVEPADLATGSVDAGRAYFIGEGKCSTCHSASGDLAGIGARWQGLNLMRRMLYPTGNPAATQLRATFTLSFGQTLVAPAVADDEFSVTVLDPLGARQTYQKSAVKVKVEDPLSAHFDRLGKYTDADIHNVYAYLESLK